MDLSRRLPDWESGPITSFLVDELVSDPSPPARTAQGTREHEVCAQNSNPIMRCLSNPESLGSASTAWRVGLEFVSQLKESWWKCAAERRRLDSVSPELPSKKG